MDAAGIFVIPSRSPSFDRGELAISPVLLLARWLNSCFGLRPGLYEPGVRDMRAGVLTLSTGRRSLFFTAVMP